MAVTLYPGPCHCSICRGSLRLPPRPGRPAAYPHEIGERPPGAPEEASPRPPVAPRRPRGTEVAPTLLSVEERIAAINARTDIGEGMKRMQIGNIMKRAKR